MTSRKLAYIDQKQDNTFNRGGSSKSWWPNVRLRYHTQSVSSEPRTRTSLTAALQVVLSPSPFREVRVLSAKAALADLCLQDLALRLDIRSSTPSLLETFSPMLCKLVNVISEYH